MDFKKISLHRINFKCGYKIFRKPTSTCETSSKLLRVTISFMIVPISVAFQKKISILVE